MTDAKEGIHREARRGGFVGDVAADGAGAAT